MGKKSGLGRGLDTIFSENEISESASGDVTRLRIAQIEPRADQPRRNFDTEALSQLADSIAQNGVLQPVLVRPSTQTGFYQLIAGERRWRASKMAGVSDIPAIIVEADELKAAQFALIENIQREDLDAWEEATAYERMIREFGLSQEELALSLGKSRSAVANALRLLDLPEEIVAMLRDGSLSAGHCRALLGLKHPDAMLPLAQRILRRNLSVRETEAAVRAVNRRAAEEAEADAASTEVEVDYLAELESRATSLIGRRLKIQAGKRRSVISIEYQNEDDLEELLVKLCGSAIME